MLRETFFTSVCLNRDPCWQHFQWVLLTGAAEVWECSQSDDVCEGEQRRSLSQVVESHPGPVHVQYDPNHLWLLSHSERGPWGSTGFILSVSQPNSPESLCRGQHVFSLPADACACNSNDPVSVVFDLHVPAVSPRAEALIAQHLCTYIEALRVFWEFKGLRAALYCSQIL